MKDVLRKTLALLLCFCMCLSLIPAAFAEEGIELAGDEPFSDSGIEEVVGDDALGVPEKAAPTANKTEEENPSDTSVGDGVLDVPETSDEAETSDELAKDNIPNDADEAEILIPGSIRDDDTFAVGSYGVNIDDYMYTTNDNPFYAKGYHGQCTWYCWGRAVEKCGERLWWGSNSYGNAMHWYNNAQGWYVCDETPSANSIMVSPDGGYWYNGEWYQTGHVMFVENVEGDYAYITEANYAGTLYHEDVIQISNGRRNWGSGNLVNVTGYIHIPNNLIQTYDPVLPDGDYIIAAAADTGYFLDIYGGEYPAASGTNVVLCYSDGGTFNYFDAWTIKYSNGYYRIAQYRQNVSLDVDDESTANGANVQVWYNNDTSAQQWQITGDASSGYRVKARCSGKNLDYQGGVLAQGTNVQQYVEDGTPAQNWMFIPYNPTYYLDVNGVLDGNSAGNVTGYGTFDIYINGTLEGNDVSDYYNSALPAGTTYEIKDIKMVDGKSYTGIKGGARAGTINSNTEVLLGFDTIPDSPGVTPSIAIFEGHTYYFYNRLSTWYAAKYMCEKLGGHLVTITSAAENAFVKAMIGNSSIWLGATDKDSEGTWKWVTGEGFSFSDWGEGEPNNDVSLNEGREDYIHMLTENGKWNDSAGSVTYPFICEIDTAYTVTYNANGGSGAPAAQVKAHGQAIKLSSTVPSRKGYTFLGWATSASATSAEYQPGDTYSADSSLTLYAIWEPMSFTVNNSPYTKFSGQTVSITPITDNSFDGYAYTRTGSYSDAVTISASNYTIQSGRLSFKSAWLDNLSAGTYYLWGIPSLDAPVYLGFMQINDAGGMSITVSPTSYTKNDPTAVPVAASGTAIPQMARFGIASASGSYTHVLNNNEYTLSGSTVTLTKDYLNSLADGTYYFIGFTSSNEQIRANSTFTVKSSTPAADAPRFTVSSAAARPGETVTLTVAVENNPGLASFEVEVVYDAATLTWTGVTQGELPGNWDTAVGEAITWIDADNYGEDGAVFTLDFQVPDSTADGDYTVSLRYDPDNVFDENAENVTFAVVPGSVTVSSRTPGDINGDDKVNNKDVLWLMRFLKGREVTVVPGSTDINGDGKNNNKDVLWLMRYIKYQNVEIH